jgi:hypothetical protein
MNKQPAGHTRALQIIRAFVVLCLFGNLMANPILPYADPIAVQLTNEIAALEGNPDRTPEQNQMLRSDQASLQAYQRESTSLRGDTGILRSLNSLLLDSYDSLLVTTISDYITDFEGRQQAYIADLAVAPRSQVRKNATTQLNNISNLLVKAAAATTTGRAIDLLDSAAGKLMSVSNTVQKALVATVAPSAMTAKIGRISFNATHRTTIGFLTNGVLNIAGFYSGADYGRGIQIFLNNVTTNTPSTYPLVGDNFATYSANASQGRVYIFQSIPETNGVSSQVTIDAITPHYMIGHFNFAGLIQGPTAASDTNQITTVTNGEFQLNFY